MNYTERLGISRAGVSKLERSTDPKLSTVRKFTEALGGAHTSKCASATAPSNSARTSISGRSHSEESSLRNLGLIRSGQA